MSGYAVTTTQHRILESAVTDLRVRAEARAVLIIDNDGRVLTHAPEFAQSSSDTVSALAAGTFVAAHELATLLGESSFRSISHEGREVSMYMEQAGDGFLVLVIFGPETVVGLVRLYTGKMIREVTPLLNQVGGQSFASVEGAGPLELDLDKPLFCGIETEP